MKHSNTLRGGLTGGVLVASAMYVCCGSSARSDGGTSASTAGVAQRDGSAQSIRAAAWRERRAWPGPY
ncbi:MAG: hypothetical protein ABI627_05465 [Polyangiaceae bacterium]